MHQPPSLTHCITYLRFESSQCPLVRNMLNEIIRTVRTATLPADRRHVVLQSLHSNLHACIHNLHHNAAYTTSF